jgi:hypothetical protein
MNRLDMHFAVPETGEFIVYFASFLILDRPTNSIISAREVTLGLEFDVRDKVVFGAPHETVVSELILHLSEENASGVHVRLRQDAE